MDGELLLSIYCLAPPETKPKAETKILRPPEIVRRVPGPQTVAEQRLARVQLRGSGALRVWGVAEPFRCFQKINKK